MATMGIRTFHGIVGLNNETHSGELMKLYGVYVDALSSDEVENLIPQSDIQSQEKPRFLRGVLSATGNFHEHGNNGDGSEGIFSTHKNILMQRIEQLYFSERTPKDIKQISCKSM